LLHWQSCFYSAVSGSVDAIVTEDVDCSCTDIIREELWAYPSSSTSSTVKQTK